MKDNELQLTSHSFVFSHLPYSAVTEELRVWSRAAAWSAVYMRWSAPPLCPRAGLRTSLDARWPPRPRRPPADRSPPGSTVRLAGWISLEKMHGMKIEQPSPIIVRRELATADEPIKFLVSAKYCCNNAADCMSNSWHLLYWMAQSHELRCRDTALRNYVDRLSFYFWHIDLFCCCYLTTNVKLWSDKTVYHGCFQWVINELHADEH